MIVRTWEQAKKATSLNQVVIATDDDRIADVCRKAGADVIMTRSDCPNGRLHDPQSLRYTDLRIVRKYGKRASQCSCNTFVHAKHLQGPTERASHLKVAIAGMVY